MDTIKLDNLNGINVLKLEGKATMKNIVAVEKILDESDKTPILDFTDLIYLDSTFLGLLAKYTMIFKKKNDEYLTIVKPNNDVVQILKNTGILKFLIVLDENILINGKELTNMAVTPKQILELHEVLMNLNDENKKTFSQVVEQMKKVVGKDNE